MNFAVLEKLVISSRFESNTDEQKHLICKAKIWRKIYKPLQQ